MTRGPRPVVEHPTTRFSRTPHLVDLVAAAERLAALLRSVEDDSAVEQLHASAAVASLRLDGSPITSVPDLDEVLAGTAWQDAGRPQQERAGTWLDALGRGQVPDEQVMAVEYRGVRAALRSDDLADALLTGPREALDELHRRLTRGLLLPEDAGRLRRSDQAVHDATVGRVLYRPTRPDAIASRLALLAGWLQSAAAREHAIVVSGVTHLELLSIHPYEAANGRLARAAARLVLRARGLDPHGLAAAEEVLADDPLGYHEEVAATHRRRDVTVWLERWGEAVSGGLRRSARRLGLVDAQPPQRALRFVDGRPTTGFTVADYRAEVGVGPEETRADLAVLLDAGRITRVPGGRGLRFEVVQEPGGTKHV